MATQPDADELRRYIIGLARYTRSDINTFLEMDLKELFVWGKAAEEINEAERKEMERK